MSQRETKNFGKRGRIGVRLGPQTEAQMEAIAKLVPLPSNAVISLGVILLAAQFAPLILDQGLSLELLEEEMHDIFADAKRVVRTEEIKPK